MDTLIQFLFRCSLGLAVGMMSTPPRKVVSGFYRVHSYVILGMSAVAAIVSWSHGSPVTPPLTVLAAAYFSALFWYFQLGPAGMAALFIVAVVSFVGTAGLVMSSGSGNSTPLVWILTLGDILTSGLLLGYTGTAMFLGHWYLNTPTMELSPLRRLIKFMGLAVVLRCAVSLGGLGLILAQVPLVDFPWIFLVLRWSAGLAGTLLVAVMAWKTLEIPNTQSATGILYVGVITVFIGELTSMLLSTVLPFPV